MATVAQIMSLWRPPGSGFNLRGVGAMVGEGFNQRAAEQRLEIARSRAAQGDLTMLKKIAPGEVDAMRKAKQDELKFKQDYAQGDVDLQKSQRENANAAALSKSQLILNAFAPAMQNASDPIAYRTGRAEGLQMIRQAVAAGQLSPQDAMELAQSTANPQQLHAVWEANVKTLDQLDPQRLDVTTPAGRVAIALGVPTAEMAERYFPDAVAAAQAELQNEANTRARSGAARNNITVGMQRRVEEDAYEAEQVLGMVDDIKELGDPGQFLGWLNRADFWSKSLADQAGALEAITDPEDRAQHSKAATFRAIVDKYRSLEFKRLIGSAQTATEIENLANAILNAKMAPEQFRVALAQLERHTARVRDTAYAILDAGDVAVGSRQYKELMKRGLQNSKQREIAEIERQMAGQPPEEIARRLQAEGLL